jgi:RNA polymerase sigma factor (sigma-70 family)
LLNDTHLAEEAVQEAFVAALLRLPDLRKDEAFPAWFRQIVRTQAHRILRKRNEPTCEVLLDSPAGEPSPPENLERREQMEALRAALQQLPVAGRETVQLHYMEGRSIGEISAALGLPSGTVKRRLHDARVRLRDLLLGSAESFKRPVQKDEGSTPTSRPETDLEGGPV